MYGEIVIEQTFKLCLSRCSLPLSLRAIIEDVHEEDLFMSSKLFSTATELSLFDKINGEKVSML